MEIKQEVQRIVTNIISGDLDRSKSFYTSLFDFEISFNSDWYIHMTSKSQNLELAIILAGHSIVPAGLEARQSGYYITIVLPDIDKFYRSIRKNVEVLRAPENTFYGQRRMLIADPDNNILDISSPTA